MKHIYLPNAKIRKSLVSKAPKSQKKVLSQQGDGAGEGDDGVGTVVAADASELAPAIYDADKHYIVPFITDPGYIDLVLDICRKEKKTP